MNRRDSLVVVDTGSVRDFTLGPELYRQSVATASIRTIEVSDGRPTGKWALGGAVIGGLALGITTYVGVHGDAKRAVGTPVLRDYVARRTGALVALGGAIVGAGLGAIVGAVAAPERWRMSSAGRSAFPGRKSPTVVRIRRAIGGAHG